MTKGGKEERKGRVFCQAWQKTLRKESEDKVMRQRGEMDVIGGKNITIKSRREWGDKRQTEKGIMDDGGEM